MALAGEAPTLRAMNERRAMPAAGVFGAAAQTHGETAGGVAGGGAAGGVAAGADELAGTEDSAGADDGS